MGDNSRPLTLTEFIDMRRSLEVELAVYIELKVDEFNRSTGTCVESVGVNFLCHQPAAASVNVVVRL